MLEEGYIGNKGINDKSNFSLIVNWSFNLYSIKRFRSIIITGSIFPIIDITNLNDKTKILM